MEAAADAVNCLNKNSISELKALPKPPAEVELVTKAILIMRGERRNFDWRTAVKMLNNP